MSQSPNQASMPFVVATSNPASSNQGSPTMPLSPIHTSTVPSPNGSPVIISAPIINGNHVQQKSPTTPPAALPGSGVVRRRQQFATTPPGSVQDTPARTHPHMNNASGATATRPQPLGMSAMLPPTTSSSAPAVVTGSSAPDAGGVGLAASSVPSASSPVGSTGSAELCDTDSASSLQDASPSELEGVEMRRKVLRPLRHAQSDSPQAFRLDQRRGSQSLVDARDAAYQRLMSELSNAQQMLQLKDEEVEKLSNLRAQMEAEVFDLTAALFDEANNQVQEAEAKRDAAERKLKEYVDKVEVLQSEVVALKHLVMTSTPSAPNKHLHPQICQVSPKKEKSNSKPFWKSHRRSTSHHEFTKESRAQVEEAQQDKSKVKESLSHCSRSREKRLLDIMLDPKMDTVCFDEFQRWKLQPSVTDGSNTFLNRVISEDIYPCLNFHNKKLAQRVLHCVEKNTLTIEPIPGDSSFPRKCSLTDMHKLCNYKIKLEEDDEWYSISQMCRNRIAAVCDFYTYVRYITQGLVKSSDKDMFQEIVRLRLQMASARLGC